MSAWEKNRNDIIYQHQGNRNPFIDHPEFADKIWGALVSSPIINYQSRIDVFPNPFKDFIHFELSSKNKCLIDTQIKLFDIFGKILMDFQTDSLVIHIPCSNINRGVYILELNYPDNSVYRKLIVKN